MKLYGILETSQQDRAGAKIDIQYIEENDNRTLLL